MKRARRQLPPDVSATPKPNDPVPNPTTGELSFGTIPQGKSRGDDIPEGEIQLRHGRHSGPNRGFGFEHIWSEHQKEMEQAGFNCKDDVPAYVETIVRAGSPIFYEGGNYRFQRVTVVRSSSGTAILELKHSNGDTIWSIVTAYSGQQKNGTRVGTVQ